MSAIDEFSRASFRGARFHVKEEREQQRRSVPLHEYAGIDKWSTEDMGLRPFYALVTAYVARMEGTRPESYALWRACMAKGPGQLVLAHGPARRVWCTEIERSHEHDVMGYIAFRIEFVEERPGGAAGALMGSAFGSITGLADALVQAVGGMIQGAGR